MDLESGVEKDYFVAPPPNPPTSVELNATLTPLGWMYVNVRLRGELTVPFTLNFPLLRSQNFHLIGCQRSPRVFPQLTPHPGSGTIDPSWH
jgi:hypothetical protein